MFTQSMSEMDAYQMNNHMHGFKSLFWNSKGIMNGF